MTSAARKLLLTVHLTASIGWPKGQIPAGGWRRPLALAMDAPVWVKYVGAAAGLLLLLVVLMLAHGGHGPAAHLHG